MSDDLDALEAEREYLEERQKHVIQHRHVSPRHFSSSQALPSSPVPKTQGNPFLMEDDEAEADIQMQDDSGSAAVTIINSAKTLPAVDLTEAMADYEPTLVINNSPEPEPAQDAMQGTTSSGRVIRLGRRKRQVGTTTFAPEINEEHASKSKHFGIPVHALLAEIEAGDTTDRSAAAFALPACAPQQGLWVDKYKPSKFTELLGDERTNRDVLRWLKHWDTCVFDRPSKAQTEDPFKRPEKRILMLTGPPGFGKTTLAHVAARQAGYNVIEINASDDRTGAVVQNKIQDALGSQAVFQARPSCILIDEIDGVSGAGGDTGFIKRLIGILQADEKALAYKPAPGASATVGSFGAAAAQPRKPKRKQAGSLLLRPILVICNDLYAPVLRTLRPYCQILHFRPAGPASLVARLRHICHNEGLSADVRALNALCEVAEHDLRACVNSLQLIRTRSRQFTLECVAGTLAQRDLSKSPHAVVETLFKLPDAKRERKKGGLAPAAAQKDGGGSGQRLLQMAELVQSTNEYGKIMDGLFAYYPAAPYHDSHLAKPLKAADWFSFYDQCARGVYEQSRGELMAYMPWSAAAMHHLFATHESPRTFERSQQAWQVRERTAAHEDGFKSLLAGCAPTLRQGHAAGVMQTDMVSYAVRILGGAGLNPVNAHLVVKQADKRRLARVVDAMLQLGVSYKQYRNEDGSYLYRLEPAIGALLDFKDAEGTLVNTGEALLPSRYAVRQAIAQECAAERIRRQQAALEAADDALDALGLGDSRATKAAAARKLELEKQAARERKRALTLADAPAQVVKKDFFGRVIQARPIVADGGDDKATGKGSMEAVKPKATVYIKFSDGFSDAVRNAISIKELLRGPLV